jgi:hypothetical protein
MHFVQSLRNGGQRLPESLDFDRKYWRVALGENLVKIKLAVLKENVALELDVLVYRILRRLRVITSVYFGRHVILDVRCYIFQCSKSMLETAQVLRHAAKSAKSMIRVLFILIVVRLGQIKDLQGELTALSCINYRC